MKNNDTVLKTSTKEKYQIVNGTVLVFSAIILYFLSFALTMAIGFDVISAGGTLLASGLAFFGLGSFFKNQMIEFQTQVNKRLRELDDNIERKKEKEDEE